MKYNLGVDLKRRMEEKKLEELKTQTERKEAKLWLNKMNFSNKHMAEYQRKRYTTIRFDEKQ